MQTNLKRLFSLLLVLVMVLGMFPGTYANDGTVDDGSLVDDMPVGGNNPLLESPPEHTADELFVIEATSHVGYSPNEDGTTIFDDFKMSPDASWDTSFINYCFSKSNIYYLPPVADWASWVDMLVSASSSYIQYYHAVDTGYKPVVGDIVVIDANADGVADSAGVVTFRQIDANNVSTTAYSHIYTVVSPNYNGVVAELVDYQFENVLGFVPLGAITELSMPVTLEDVTGGSSGGNTGTNTGGSSTAQGPWEGGWLENSIPGVAIQVVYYKYKDVYNVDGLWGQVTNTVTTYGGALDQYGDALPNTIYTHGFIPDVDHFITHPDIYQGGLFLANPYPSLGDVGKVMQVPTNAQYQYYVQNSLTSRMYSGCKWFSNLLGVDAYGFDDPALNNFFQRIIYGNNWGNWDIGDVRGPYSTYAKVLRLLGVQEEFIINYCKAIQYESQPGDFIDENITEDDWFTVEDNGEELIPVLIWKTVIEQDNIVNANTGAGKNQSLWVELYDIAEASVAYGREEWYRDVDDTGWILPKDQWGGYEAIDLWLAKLPYDVTTERVKNDAGEWVTRYSSSLIEAIEIGCVLDWNENAPAADRHRCGWSCDSSYACKHLLGTGHGRYRHGDSAYSWTFGHTDGIGVGYVNSIPADNPYSGLDGNVYYTRNYWGPFGAVSGKGSFMIEKVDATNTSKKLAGVEFTLYTDKECTNPVTVDNFYEGNANASGTIGYESVAVRKTRSDGQCTYVNLKPGVYFLEETKGLDGYAGMVGSKRIVVNKDDVASTDGNCHQIGNTPTKVTGTFKKNVANGTNADLAGWLFNVYTDANCTNLYPDVPMPVVTGSDGKAQIELKPGTYWVKEVGHQDTNIWNSEYLTSDTTAQRIEIVGGQDPFELTITNTYYGKLQVTKSVNAGSAEGWQFNVYSNSACTTLVTTITTDANGIAKTGKLTPGTYWVKEVVGTSSYWTYDTKTVQVTVNAKQTATAGLTFTNTQYGRLTLSKSTNTGTSLGGWKFGIYTDKNCTSLATYKDGGNAYLTTDANGNATSGYLLPGTYYVKEIDESASYPYWGYTNVVKKGVVAAGADTAVSGGSFENTQYGRLSVQKATNTGAQIIGWTFNVYTDSACTNLAKDRNGNNVVLTTDANGRATSGYLLPGTYFIKEVGGTAYDEYWVMDTAAKSVAVVAGADATAVTFTNTEYGRFTLRKDTNTGASRDGWVFSVYTNSACTTPAKDKNGNNVTLTTDANGNATSGYLLPGTYYVKETGGTRYNNEYWVVDTSAKTVVVTAGTTNQTPAVFTNTQYGRVVVEKSTNTGANLNDWVFTVYTDANCRNVAKDKNGNNVTMTTDTQGDAISGYLLPGTYYVKETGGSRYADNYYWTVSTEVKTVTVVAGSDVRPAEGNGVFVNTHYGRLRIVKDMDTLELNGTKKLAGWQFRITRNSDGADMGVYTTDANGEIITDKLLPGDYTITEIIDSVNGYYYCETQNPVRSVVVAGQTSLVGGNERANVSFVNALRPMKIVLDKVNEKGEPLRGVVFSLEWSTDGRNWQRVKYSNAENVVVGNCGSAGLGSDGTLVTDANGHLEFVNLYPNIYYRVIEEATVNGYALLPEPHVIRPADVDVQTLTYDMTVVNTPGYTLPEAGVSDMSMNLMIIGGTTAAMLVLFCLFTNLSVFNRRKAIKNKK